MPGFWEYFQQFSDSLNQKQNSLLDRQYNLANMWNQNAQQESEAAQNYMGMQSGLLGQRAGIAQAVGDNDRWGKTYQQSQDEFAYKKEADAKALDLENKNMENNLNIARLNASRGGGGNDMQYLSMFLEMMSKMQGGKTDPLLPSLYPRGDNTESIVPPTKGSYTPTNPFQNLGNIKIPQGRSNQ